MNHLYEFLLPTEKLEPIHTKNILVDIDSVVSYTRSNGKFKHTIPYELSKKNKTFYIHFLDGDHWGRNERFLEEGYFGEEENLLLFEIAPWKDAIFRYADEFFLFSDVDLTKELQETFTGRSLQFTGITIETKQIYWKDILNFTMTKIKEVKQIKRGEFYGYTFDEGRFNAIE